MIDKYFLDTNIVVYAFDKREKYKQSIAKQYLNRLFTNENYVLSLQIVNEFCNVAQKKLEPAISTENLRAFIRLIPENRIMPFSRPTTLDALRIQQQHTLSFWDSMIVATAILGGCTYIVTENLSDSQKIETVTILKPFKKSA